MWKTGIWSTQYPNIFIQKGKGSTWPKRSTKSRQVREKLLLLNSKSWGPHSEPDSRPRFHQTAASLLSLPLLGVLTSAHINKVDGHRKGGNHTQSYKQAKGWASEKVLISYTQHTISYSSINGRHPHMRHHEAFAELHPYKRHHHVAFVELRRGLEAPPRYPCGITSWSWGTTVNPQLEVHGIRSNNWGTTVNSP